MTSKNDHIGRWIDVCLGRTSRGLFAGKSNVFASGDKIYSYGYHFEMARVLRDPKGKPRAFLLNGDRYSSTTSGHQSNVRHAIARQDLPSVIIPYSALSAAGINFDTVELVDVTKDRHIETKHVTYEQPEHTKWVKVKDKAYVELAADELEAKVAERNAKEAEHYKRICRYAEEEPGSHWDREVEQGPKVTTVDELPPWDRREYRTIGTHMELLWNRGWRDITVELLDDGRTKYSWTTHRHLLGESLVRTRIDGKERWVRCSCVSAGTTVLCKKCQGSGGRYVKPRNRWAYFLSGFDHNERRAVYFFCELPRGVHPTTVDEAYEDLKPDTVKIAEQMSRTIHRQGDIFAIEMRDLTKRDLRARGARFEKRGNLLRTNHEATEVAYLPDGTTLVRGTLWHNPAGRPPDHRRVTVGKSWHVVVKNTVPVNK
jgi:hypothetical protein